MSSYPQLVSSYVDRNGPNVQAAKTPAEPRNINYEPGSCMDAEKIPPNQSPPEVGNRQCMVCERLPPCDAPPPPENKCPMTPPLYPDLGKEARDVFGKGYHFGLIKLDIKTKTSNGVEFTSSGVANKETEKTFGSLETKYKFKDHGVTLAERWNTDNVIGTEVTFADFCEGAKLAVGANFIPHAGQRSFTLKADFRNELLALNLDTNLQSEKAVIRGGSVLGYHGLLCGYQTAYDTSKKKLIENKVSMAFLAKEFVLMSSINSGQVFTGSVYHKVNPNLETAINLSWSADSNETSYAIAAKYAFDSDGAVRFKVDNQSMVGLGYSQKLRKGITLYLSLQVDGKDLNEGSHKVGFALEMEA